MLFCRRIQCHATHWLIVSELMRYFSFSSFLAVIFDCHFWLSLNLQDFMMRRKMDISCNVCCLGRAIEWKFEIFGNFWIFLFGTSFFSQKRNIKLCHTLVLISVHGKPIFFERPNKYLSFGVWGTFRTRFENWVINRWMKPMLTKSEKRAKITFSFELRVLVPSAIDSAWKIRWGNVSL